MAKFSTTNSNNTQPTQQPQLIIPPSARRDVDFDDEKVPLSQRLGDFSDKTFGFIFNPNTIKFGILLFAGFCIAINLAGYYDLVNQVFTTRLDELGRTLPVEAPIGERIMNSIVRLPFLGTALVWLDQLTGGLVALVGAIAFCFMIQGLEIAGRFHLYFPESAENLLYKQNRKRYEAPGNHPAAQKAYKLATTEILSILRWLAIAGYVAYLVDAYAMHLSRPWLDNLSNPLWINVIWNGLAVAGVELAMILHRGYKAVTLSHTEKADKDRLY